MYDGRGSVVQTLTIPVAGQSTMAALPDTQVKVQSFSYTAFGEQMSRKISGFGYNAEAFDAACGMINLRARQYEPGMNRFGQKDIVRGQIYEILSPNRYAYCFNNPLVNIDPSGETVKYGGANDKGYYHRLVQDDIVTKHNNVIKTELRVLKTNNKFGRIDLLNFETGEVWEVKPQGVGFQKNPIKYLYKVNNQLNTYLEGKLIDSVVMQYTGGKFIKGGPLSGIISDQITNSTVLYRCWGDGIVWYSVNKPGQVERAPVRVPNLSPIPKKNEHKIEKSPPPISIPSLPPVISIKDILLTGIALITTMMTFGAVQIPVGALP